MPHIFSPVDPIQRTHRGPQFKTRGFLFLYGLLRRLFPQRAITIIVREKRVNPQLHNFIHYYFTLMQGEILLNLNHGILLFESAHFLNGYFLPMKKIARLLRASHEKAFIIRLF